jgi:hypothetical protein
MMETKFEYIRMVEVAQKPDRKTQVWAVLSNRSNSILGHIKWHGAWRQYCFFPSNNCLFNTGCMNNIVSFIGEAMLERKS